MLVVHSAAHRQHAPLHEFLDGRMLPYQESPARMENILAALSDAGVAAPIEPDNPDLEPILAVHDPVYVEWLKGAHDAWLAAGGNPEGAVADTFAVRRLVRRPASPRAALGYYTYDATTVITAGTWPAAQAAAACAVTAARRVQSGAGAAFALCRPPGHHAHADLCGGYCFLNNAAIAAEWLASHGGPNRRVAILDIDFHHGNGTQDIFYDRGDVLFVSIHADPERQYPYFLGGRDERGTGDGTGATVNFPLPAGVDDAGYLATLGDACTRVRAFAPAWLVVSLGVDTFGRDPLGDFALTSGAFALIGRRIAGLGLPTVLVMEGGYAIGDLGRNVVAVLQAFRSA